MKRLALVLFVLLAFALSSSAASVTRMACADSGFTTATTWEVCDATSELDSEAGSTPLTTSAVYSAAFVPGAITVDGVAVKVAMKTNAPTAGATVTIVLRDSSNSTDIKSVTINVADIPGTDPVKPASEGNYGVYPHGWLFVKFDSPTLLVATTNYVIGASSSVAGQISIYRNSTAGNWSRQVRTTATGAPAAGDKLIITGEHTAAGAITARTVTMNNTDTTTFGAIASATFCQSIVVCDQGTLAWDTSASVINNLTVAGLFLVGEGGTVTMGTAAVPTPSTSTNQLSFNCTATGDSELRIQNGGTFKSFGAAINQTWAYLYSDVSAGAANTNYTIISKTYGSATGWGANDAVVFGTTYRSGYGRYEARTNSTITAVTNLTLQAGQGFTYDHPSTNAVLLCPVGNLTRNVKIVGESSSLYGVYYAAHASTNSIYFTEFCYMGTGGGYKEASINCYVGTGDMDVRFCSIYNANGYGFYAQNSYLTTTGLGSGTPIITFVSNVVFTVGSGSIPVYVNDCYNGAAGTGNGTEFSSNLLIGSASASTGLFRFIGKTGGYAVITNNVVCGGLGYGYALYHKLTDITFTDNTAHCCNGYGLVIATFLPTESPLTVTRYRGIRCGGYGAAHQGFGAVVTAGNVKFDGCSFIGNAYAGLAAGSAQNIVMTNCVFTGEAANAQLGGIVGHGMTNWDWGSVSGGLAPITLINSTLGSPVAHTTADIYGYQDSTEYQINAYNTTFASTTPVTIPTYAVNSFVGSEKHQGVGGFNAWWTMNGRGSNDVVIYKTAPASMRVLPSSAASKCVMPDRYCVRVPVDSAATRTVNVWVRKSEAGDGAAYNGNEPRLIAKADYGLGVTSDTVIDTVTAAVGTWEQLTGETPAVSADGTLVLYVDCDGTAGWINVDDWSFDALDSRSMDYWFRGFPQVEADNATGGGGSGSASHTFVQ